MPLTTLATLTSLLINRCRPRSNLTETIDGKEIPSFRGDNINGFSPSDRALDPNRLIRCVLGLWISTMSIC
jgi:3-deoxy-D-arabino-heptulosonate 7-phosphate (DAHP) synthase class II